MIGKEELVLDANEWTVKGMSTGQEIGDGGFSNETDGVNLKSVPGVIYASATAVDGDSDNRLTGNIIATSPDMALASADNRLLVADNDTYYRYNGTKIIAAAYTGGTASTTAAGFTDIVTYRGEAYVSCKERIKRWQNNNTITDLGSFTTSTVPHPMLVYENNFYAADSNLLLQATAVNTMPTTILTLDVNQIIIALGIDPGTGLMLISTKSTLDVSSTLPSINRLLWYDGNSSKVTKSVIVEDAILGFFTVGGVTYVGYGTNLGYINGSGISFLRKLKNVTNSNTELPYKHHFAYVENTLYVLDGLQILAYGEVLPGRKIFYYCFKNNNSLASKSVSLANVGNGKLAIGFATSVPGFEFNTVDTTSVASTNTMTFYSNKYFFPKPVFLRSAYVEYADAVANNDDNRSLYYATETVTMGSVILRAQYSSGSDGGLKNTSGSSVSFIDNVIGFSGSKVRWIQFRYNTSATNYGLRRIILYYDVAE
jgi:hypothetical protein